MKRAEDSEGSSPSLVRRSKRLALASGSHSPLAEIGPQPRSQSSSSSTSSTSSSPLSVRDVPEHRVPPRPPPPPQDAPVQPRRRPGMRLGTLGMQRAIPPLGPPPPVLPWPPRAIPPPSPPFGTALGKIISILEGEEQLDRASLLHSALQLGRLHELEVSRAGFRRRCIPCENDASFLCCQSVRYCSSECQLVHWSRSHSRVCGRRQN